MTGATEPTDAEDLMVTMEDIPGYLHQDRRQANMASPKDVERERVEPGVTIPRKSL